MIKLTFYSNKLLLLLMLCLSILPTINIGSFGMPVLYLLMPIGVMVLIIILFGWIKIPKIVKSIILLFLLIIIEILISAWYSTVITLDRFVFPTDITQYIARALFLITFIVVFYKGKVDADDFIKYFLIVLTFAMIIGILQWIPWPGREFFIKLYPFREGVEQLLQLARPLHLIRVHGFAQHATANGGFAAFAFVFGYSVKRYYRSYPLWSNGLIILSIVNVFISQARAGILALIVSIFLFYIISLRINKKSYKPTLYMIFTILLLGVGIGYLYSTGNAYINQMVYRWNILFTTGGGGRIDQAKYFFSLMNGVPQCLFGLSKPVVNMSAISYGVEIEPVNIFITYGSIGFVLQYALIIMLLLYFFKRIGQHLAGNASFALLTASFVSLFSYQVFSIAYFFFREIRIGLFPWILMGVAIGVYEREKFLRRSA